MPISWGGARGVNVGICGSPMECLGIAHPFKANDLGVRPVNPNGSGNRKWVNQGMALQSLQHLPKRIEDRPLNKQETLMEPIQFSFNWVEGSVWPRFGCQKDINGI